MAKEAHGVRRRGVIIAGTGLILLAVIAIAAAIVSRRTKTVAESTSKPPAGSAYAGTVTATLMRYDPRASEAELQVEVATEALRAADGIEKLSFSDAERELSRNLVNWRTKPENTAATERTFDAQFAVPDGEGSRTRVIKNFTLTVPTREVWSEAWFPFDAWSFDLVPQLRVEKPEHRRPFVEVDRLKVIVGEAPRGELSVMKVTRLEQPRREPEGTKEIDHGFRIVVVRQVFIRVMAFLLIVIVMAYIYYLIRYETPRDQILKSLATVAALWGLRGILVPKQILIFPTLLDFVLLALIALLFLVTVIKFETKGSTP